MKPFQLRDSKTGKVRHGGQWVIKYRAPDRTWRQVLAGGTEKEAREKLAEIETDIRRGTWQDPRAIRAEARTRETDCRTFGDIVKRFAVHYADRADNSRKNLGVVTHRLFHGTRDGGLPLLPASTPIAALTPARLRRMREDLAAAPLAVATKNGTLTFTKMILRWAWKHPSIPLEDHPALDLAPFRSAGIRGGDGFCNAVSKSEVWTHAEAVAMCEAAETRGPEVSAVMLRTALETGMRVGELCGLLWSGVDFDRRLILVSRNYDRRGTKSGKDRVVPMSAGLVVRLRRWKAASPESQEHDPVFPDDKGRVRKQYHGWAYRVAMFATVAGAWRRDMKRAGHLTRHYYATQWLLNGGSAEQLARVLGHVDTSLICKVYSHFQDGDFVATVDRIGLSLEAPPAPAPVARIGG